MAIEIVDLPIENGGSFHSYVAVYQEGMYYTTLTTSVSSMFALAQPPYIAIYSLGIAATVSAMPANFAKGLMKWDMIHPGGPARIWKINPSTQPGYDIHSLPWLLRWLV